MLAPWWVKALLGTCVWLHSVDCCCHLISVVLAGCCCWQQLNRAARTRCAARTSGSNLTALQCLVVLSCIECNVCKAVLCHTSSCASHPNCGLVSDLLIPSAVVCVPIAAPVMQLRGWT
jgi:hypothetical protein